MLHSDIWIVRPGFWGGQKDEAGMKASSDVRPPDELSTDSTPLECLINGQIRQVRAVTEVGNGSRYANQKPCRIARRDDDVSIRQHLTNRL